MVDRRSFGDQRRDVGGVSSFGGEDLIAGGLGDEEHIMTSKLLPVDRWTVDDRSGQRIDDLTQLDQGRGLDDLVSQLLDENTASSSISCSSDVFSCDGSVLFMLHHHHHDIGYAIWQVLDIIFI